MRPRTVHHAGLALTLKHSIHRFGRGVQGPLSGWAIFAAAGGQPMAATAVPFPPPPGWKWIFVARFYHWRAKKFLYAKDYNKDAFVLLVKSKCS